MSQQNEITDIKKKILSTGIRVGTAVKTKFMIPYVTQASPEGLYLMDLDITLARIQTAAKFINRVNIEDVIVCSGRVYANTPIEKFCEITSNNLLVISSWNPIRKRRNKKRRSNEV